MKAARGNRAPAPDAARQLRPASGLVPPNDLDAEAAVLSSLLLDPGVYEEHLRGTLAPKHFYSDANRRIYAAAEWVHSAHHEIDAVAIASRLRDEGRLQQIGGTPYLSQLADATPAVAHVAEHAVRVIDRWRRRELIGAAQISVANAYDGPECTQDLLESHASMVTELAYETGRQGGLSRIDGAATLDHAIAAARGSGTVGLTTGLRRLDALLGGFAPGDVHVFAGRPGMGKTQYMLHLARKVAWQPRIPADQVEKAHHIAVGIFSLEMSTAHLQQRILAQLSHVDLGRLRKGYIRNPEYDQLAQAAQDFAQLNIYVDDEDNLSPAEMHARAKRLQRQLRRAATATEETHLGLIIVDYLQITAPDKESGNREQDVASMTRAFKRMAKRLGVPLVVLAQLNRAVEMRPLNSRRPVLSDLRESGAIEQDADSVVFLYRDDYYRKEDSDRPGVLEFIIGKQRSGPHGTASVRFDISTGEMFDLVEEGSPEPDQFDDYAEFDETPPW